MIFKPTDTECAAAGKGYWSWIPGLLPKQPGFRLFRRAFEVADARKLDLYVTADCRYKFYLDGQLLSVGPVRSPIWYTQLAHVEAQVAAGRHVLSVEVVVWADGWFPCAAPIPEMHVGGGLYVSCADDELKLSTPDGWRGSIDESRRTLGPKEEQQGYDYFETSHEVTDFSKDPGDWKALDFDDSAWKELFVPDFTPNIHNSGVKPATSTWWAMEMPQLRTQPRESMAVKELLPGETSLEILPDGSVKGVLPAGHSEAELVFEKYLTGFLEVSGGASPDGRVELRQAERADWKRWQNDILLTADKAWSMETFDFRAMHRLRIVSDLKSPMPFALKAEFCAYDFGKFQDYHSEDPMLEKIYEVGVHTARCCAHDTYEDCPFFERLQYEGDTRIQSLISYEATGNGELGRKALLDFQRSQCANGLTQSRFPNNLPQYIPGYSLIWVLMIQDYMSYFPEDKELLHRLLWNIEGVLRYYADRVDPKTGLAGHPAFWAFTDWVSEWRVSRGDPSRDGSSPTAIENLFYAYALKAAAELARLDGDLLHAEHYERQRQALVEAINRNFLDRERGLYVDVVGKPWTSRHAQALAVLVGCVPAEVLPTVQRALLEDLPGLSLCTLYFQFYVLDALRVLGDREGLLRAMKPWRECLDRSPWLTTFPEIPNADESRSMCHAWSAAPVYFLLRCKL